MKLFLSILHNVILVFTMLCEAVGKYAQIFKIFHLFNTLTGPSVYCKVECLHNIYSDKYVYWKAQIKASKKKIIQIALVA